MADKLEERFSSITLADLPVSPLKDVKVLTSDMTVREAVEFLHSNGILSAPVADPAVSEDAPWQQRYKGVVDMIKLTVLMLDSMEVNPAIREEEEGETEEAPVSRKLVLQELSTHFSEMKIGELTEKSQGWFPFLPLQTDATLLDALTLLGTYKMKRLPLLNPQGKLINMVTQSSVLHLLSVNMDKYKEIGDKTLEQIGLGEAKDVLAVHAHEPVQHAFDIIRKKNVSAVPVLGEDGVLIGNISARHVYYIITARNKLRLLKMAANHFIAATSDQEATWDIKNTAISCKKTDKVSDVIKRMDAARIHRIYIVDEHNRPFRVIALCDVLAKFVNEPEEVGTCALL